MHPRIAAFFSNIGNPFLLFPVVISYLAARELGYKAAKPLLFTMLAIFGILAVFLFVRKQRGEITNLDVSNQKQRALNIYLPTIIMLLLAIAYFQWTKQPYVFRTLYVGLLLITCFALNFWKKISLHTVVATYLSSLLLSTNYWLGIAFFVFSFLIAWSRVVLERHTKTEVLLGWVVGSLFGLGYAWIF